MTPELSVVVANTQPWPEARRCLEALAPQLAEGDCELVVVDGSDGATPSELPANTRWLKRRGASPYQLRAAGVLAALGGVVAVTEDHCVPRRDFCRNVLAAHRRWPELGVIGGAVENGATGRLIDWALFLISNSVYVAPLPSGELVWNFGQANVSYKRRVLPEAFPETGLVEERFQAELRARGERFGCDPAIVVDHVQSLGWPLTYQIAFHDGRCHSGFRGAPPHPRETLRWAAAPLVVAHFVGRLVLRMFVRKRRHRREALLSAPVVASVLVAHLSGGFVGWLWGPGDSPSKMR